MIAACLISILAQPPRISATEQLKQVLSRTSEFLAPRFRPEAPCPTVPPVMIDQHLTGVGLACETAKANRWQARILWIDATANIDRYNSPDKIRALTRRIAQSGFNTVVFDIKPISGQTVYPSQFAPKLTDWRGQHLPESFDPVPDMVADCHQNGLSILVSLNAFSEGHRLFKVGPGYKEPEQQSVLYVPVPVLRVGNAEWPLAQTLNKPESGTIEVATALHSQDGTFCAAVSPSGTVDEAFQLDQPIEVMTPKGDDFLIASGDAADFLRGVASKGAHLDFDTHPNYVRMADLPGRQIPLMMDPNDPQVRAHALDMIREVVSKYPVDGVIYDDRLRYAGLDGDFSDASRYQFESFVGQKLTWPDDVFKFTIDRHLKQGIQPGRCYDVWLAWRAARVKDFVADVRQTVRDARPGTLFGVYAGSWYGDYPALGHNYASDQTAAGFPFLTPTYRAAGDASLLDCLIVGCYYQTPTMYDAMREGQNIGTTIEGAGTLCNRLARAETWTYAGIDCGPFAKDPKELAAAVQAACASTQGVMVFDLSHNVNSLWDVFARIFAQPQKAPHQIPGALARLRRLRADYDRYGVVDPPIAIAAGSSGAGQ